MEYVKMPELLSAEAARVLAGNMEAVKDMLVAREEASYGGGCHDDDCCCPKKIKFIFVLNNVVIINVNAVCEEEDNNPGHGNC
ncbi:MAG: hypothetical protein PHC45_03730 [Clostridiaceae bacterium]|nr:hypothetical protein [Clostridiaceae bacterium]